MTTINVDFETRSTVDLRTRGVYAYAQHLTTDVWCMAWAIDDGPVQLWRMGEPFPDELYQYMVDEEQGRDRLEWRAWNAQFERTIWNNIMVPRYGWPWIPLESWHCTAAEASAMGLPRALGDAAKVLRLEEQKDERTDEEGYKIALRMSRPRKVMKDGTIIWWDTDPAKLKQLHEYCPQDVRTERGMMRVLRRLSPIEREIYLMDQRINDRGILIDVPLAMAAAKITEEGLERANTEIHQLTNGAVTAVTKVADLTAWLKDTHGVDGGGVRKSVVRELLEGELPGPARRALEIRADAGRSSVSKIKTMLEARCDDDRVRGMFLYHGAGPGRWTGRLLQVQNFLRPEIKNAEEYIDWVLENEYDLIELFHPPIKVIASLLRGMLRAADGARFIVYDFAQIEARVLAWLAGQDDLVQLFANKGKVYETFAAKLYGVPVAEITKNDPRRQFGKNMVLGCGYQMGADTYQTQAKEQMGVEITDEFAQETIDAYRELVPNIVAFWKDVNKAAINAVREPGKVFDVRGCKFTMRGNWLWLMLPSKRPLAFHRPRVVSRRVETPAKSCGKCSAKLAKADGGQCKCGFRTQPNVYVRDAVKVWGLNSMTRQWSPYYLYGGLLTENIVQALSRDLLAQAMLRVEKAGYQVVLHAHDELVTETPVDFGSAAEVERLMSVVPPWAAGCPIAVEGYESPRYRK